MWLMPQGSLKLLGRNDQPSRLQSLEVRQVIPLLSPEHPHSAASKEGSGRGGPLGRVRTLSGLHALGFLVLLALCRCHLQVHLCHPLQAHSGEHTGHARGKGGVVSATTPYIWASSCSDFFLRDGTSPGRRESCFKCCPCIFSFMWQYPLYGASNFISFLSPPWEGSSGWKPRANVRAGREQ